MIFGAEAISPPPQSQARRLKPDAGPGINLELSPHLLEGGSLDKKPAMRFLTGTSHILVPFPALRLAEARSDRGPSIVALETETCWIPPSAGARVRDPQRVDCNHRVGLQAISFLT
jgi:hypothetical protein